MGGRISWAPLVYGPGQGIPAARHVGAGSRSLGEDTLKQTITPALALRVVRVARVAGICLIGPEDIRSNQSPEITVTARRTEQLCHLRAPNG